MKIGKYLNLSMRIAKMGVKVMKAKCPDKRIIRVINMVKITVLGSYNQDITMITPKIPRPKETISGATMYLNPGGKGNNQANAAHKLGVEVLLIAKVGKDPFGMLQFNICNRKT